MNQNSDMKALADAIWVYLEPKIRSLTQNSLSYFRAEVVAAPANGKITVRKPFDTTAMQLPYVSSAASLAAGEQCLVLQLGDASNCIVAGNGTLSGL